MMLPSLEIRGFNSSSETAHAVCDQTPFRRLVRNLLAKVVNSLHYVPPRYGSGISYYHALPK
jgi:hypothetical protein